MKDDGKVTIINLSREEIQDYLNCGARFRRGPIVDNGAGTFSQELFLEFHNTPEMAACLAKHKGVFVISGISS